MPTFRQSEHFLNSLSSKTLERFSTEATGLHFLRILEPVTPRHRSIAHNKTINSALEKKHQYDSHFLLQAYISKALFQERSERSEASDYNSTNVMSQVSKCTLPSNFQFFPIFSIFSNFSIFSRIFQFFSNFSIFSIFFIFRILFFFKFFSNFHFYLNVLCQVFLEFSLLFEFFVPNFSNFPIFFKFSQLS